MQRKEDRDLKLYFATCCLEERMVVAKNKSRLKLEGNLTFGWHGYL